MRLKSKQWDARRHVSPATCRWTCSWVPLHYSCTIWLTAAQMVPQPLREVGRRQDSGFASGHSKNNRPQLSWDLRRNPCTGTWCHVTVRQGKGVIVEGPASSFLLLFDSQAKANSKTALWVCQRWKSRCQTGTYQGTSQAERSDWLLTQKVKTSFFYFCHLPPVSSVTGTYQDTHF